MHHKTDNLVSICATCPRRRFGLCKALLELLKQQNNLQNAQRLLIKPKEHLFHQGDKLHATYILKEGWIQIYRTTAEGKRQVFPSVLPGELLGLHLDIHEAATFSAVAMCDSLICVVPNLGNLCLSDSKLALRLSWLGSYDTLMSEMYLANIAQCSAKERIAFMAIELYRRMEFRGLNDGFIIPFPLKQTDIADTLGLTAIHVNRTLESLKKEGLLEIHQHKLTILDYPAVCRLVADYLDPINECELCAL